MKELNLEAIARQLGSAHGIPLDKEDPILMVATMLRELFIDHEDGYTIAFAKLQSDLSSKISDWGEKQRKLGAESLNKSLREADKIMRERAMALATESDRKSAAKELQNLKTSILILFAIQASLGAAISFWLFK